MDMTQWHSLRCRFASKGGYSPSQLLKLLYSEFDFDTYMKFMLDFYTTGEFDLEFLYGRVSYKTFMVAYELQGNYEVRPVYLI